MQDAVAEARTVAPPRHPLDPLTPDEIRRAAAAVRAAHDLGVGMMFETISLHEPDKSVAHGATPGAAFAREAFVCAFDRTNGKVWEARSISSRIGSSIGGKCPACGHVSCSMT